MSQRRQLGRELFNISKMIKKSYDEHMENNSSSEDFETIITTNNAEILAYLHDNQDKEIFQKDIEELLSIKAPTVTEILKKMEQKQWITRINSKIDGRFKRINITAKGISTRLETLEKVNELENRINSSITEQEKEAFLKILDKIKNDFK